MIITLENGKQARGDLISKSILRSDLSPMPMTLEVDFRVDDLFMDLLREGKTFTTATEDKFLIIKTEKVDSPIVQGDRKSDLLRVTSVFEPCQSLIWPLPRAVLKEDVALSAIYKALGAKLATIVGDFPVDRFFCPVGFAPSFHINRILQEQGGVVRWKAGKLEFIRLSDAFKQKSAASLPSNASDNVEAKFLQFHDIPTFISLKPDGGHLIGGSESNRVRLFSPFKNELQLHHMSKSLVLAKKLKTDFNLSISAGDLISFAGEDPLVVITAAHVYESGTEGRTPSQYTKLWLGRIGEK